MFPSLTSGRGCSPCLTTRAAAPYSGRGLTSSSVTGVTPRPRVTPTSHTGEDRAANQGSALRTNSDQSQLRISPRLARQPHGGLQLCGGRVRGPGACPALIKITSRDLNCLAHSISSMLSSTIQRVMTIDNVKLIIKI